MIKIIHLILIYALLLSSACVEGTSASLSVRNLASTDSSDTDSGNSSEPTSGALFDLPTTGEIDYSDDDVLTPKILMTHFIDPFDGTYSSKLTLPKNYKGMLYIAGINFSSLNNYPNIKVRITLGKDSQSLTFDALVVNGVAGLTSTANIDVLAIDMTQRPLQDLRLPYDLYDYTGIDTDDLTTVWSKLASTFDSSDEDDYATDPRDNDLYCRGLSLQYDSTFKDSNNDSLCKDTNDVCLYSYAKVMDSGLVGPFYDEDGVMLDLDEDEFLDSTVDIASHPVTSTQVVTNDIGTDQDQVDSFKNLNTVLARVLPSDAYPTTFMLGANSISDENFTFKINSTDYVYEYKGPYRNVDQFDSAGNLLWEMSYTASPAGPNSIYASLVSSKFYGKSYLFPKIGTLSLSRGTKYYDINNDLETMSADGDSELVWGSNIRASTYDPVLAETIASCNVSAKIEIIRTDTETYDEVVMASTEDDFQAGKLKLQVIRASDTDYLGQETIYTSFKSCSASAECGSGECCYNNRCWDKSLTTQCLEDVEGQGELTIGEDCNTDYDCESLCCNSTTKVCSPHVSSETESVLCSKSVGQHCISRQWCKEEMVKVCNLYKMASDSQGNLTCGIRCFYQKTFGDCINNVCQTPDDQLYLGDTTDLDCSEALDPPTDVDFVN